MVSVAQYEKVRIRAAPFMALVFHVPRVEREPSYRVASQNKRVLTFSIHPVH